MYNRNQAFVGFQYTYHQFSDSAFVIVSAVSAVKTVLEQYRLPQLRAFTERASA